MLRNCTVIVVDMVPALSEVKVGVASDIDSEDWRGSLLASLDAIHVVVKPSSLPAVYLGSAPSQSGWSANRMGRF